MNENLHPAQFSQERLFPVDDLPEPEPQEPEPAWMSDPAKTYLRLGHGGGAGWDTPNPLYDAEAPSWRRMEYGSPQEEWIEPWKVRSRQKEVSQGAVDYITRTADLVGAEMERPTLTREDDGNLSVWNGNHRINAAQRQGRLIIPARVGKGVPWL